MRARPSPSFCTVDWPSSPPTFSGTLVRVRRTDPFARGGASGVLGAVFLGAVFLGALFLGGLPACVRRLSCDLSDARAGATLSCPVSGWTDRGFELELPPSWDGKSKLPLIVAFHGGGGAARRQSLEADTPQALPSCAPMVPAPARFATFAPGTPVGAKAASIARAAPPASLASTTCATSTTCSPRSRRSYPSTTAAYTSRDCPTAAPSVIALPASARAAWPRLSPLAGPTSTLAPAAGARGLCP